MKNRFLILLTIFICCSFCKEKELTCLDFKNGEFTILDDNGKVFDKVFRNENSHFEISISEYKEGNDSARIYETVEWINDCKFVLKYDSSKMKLSEEDKLINNEGGLTIELLQNVDNCFTYIATTTIKGQTFKQSGKICKD